MAFKSLDLICLKIYSTVTKVLPDLRLFFRNSKFRLGRSKLFKKFEASTGKHVCLETQYSSHHSKSCSDFFSNMQSAQKIHCCLSQAVPYRCSQCFRNPQKSNGFVKIGCIAMRKAEQLRLESSSSAVKTANP